MSLEKWPLGTGPQIVSGGTFGYDSLSSSASSNDFFLCVGSSAENLSRLLASDQSTHGEISARVQKVVVPCSFL